MDAEREARIALELAPNDPLATFLLGVSLLRQERFQEAANTLATVSGVMPPAERIDPRGFQRAVELSLSNALRRAGDPAGALAHAELALAAKGPDPETVGNLGLCLLDAGRAEDAKRPFSQLIQLAPQAPFGHHGLAMSLQRSGRPQEAIARLRTAASLTPSGQPLLVEIAETLAELGDPPGAEETASRAHAAAPSLRTDLLMASSLLEKGKPAQAEPLAQDAVTRDPESGRAWALLGAIQQALGRKEEAEESLKKSVRLLPLQGSAWHSLSRMQPAQNDLIEQMEKVYADERLSDADRTLLGFSLGQSYERGKRFQEAFETLSEANALARRQKFGDEKFDPEVYTRELWAAAKLYENLKPLQPIDPAPGTGPQPIFVVGMIRSGTTLVQQILSCHPEVAAGGEIPFWIANWRSLVNPKTRSIDPDKLSNLRSAYLRQLRDLGSGKRFVVDKMPENYAIAGLLALVFPSAPIINLVRDPKDTMVSIFATANRSTLRFMHDLDAIAVALLEYQRLMRRWHELLPNRIFDLSYEALVSNQEPVTRTLLEACRLEWSDACLFPEKNLNVAATPSRLQVKAPVNRSSVGRFVAYAPWMSKALASLSNQT